MVPILPSRFQIWPTPGARARQHLHSDDGLAPYISRLVCRSVNVLYLGCFRRRKILECAKRLSEYLLARLVDLRQSTRNRIQWNDEALDDSDAIWRMCFLAYPSDDKAWLWALVTCPILRKQISFPCHVPCYLILSGHGTMYQYLTRFNKIAIQGTPQMAVDKAAIRLSRVYSYDSKYTCPYSMCNPP